MEVAKAVDGESHDANGTHDVNSATANVDYRQKKELVPRKKRVKKKQREEKREWRRFKRKSSKRRKEIETEDETDGDRKEAEKEKQGIELTQF